MTPTELTGLVDAVDRLAALVPVLLAVAVAVALIGAALAMYGGRR
jgi:hypothetical protein